MKNENNLESQILFNLKDKRAKGFPTIHLQGHTEQGHEYIVMDKLGPNLKSMIRRYSDKRFTLKDVVQIGIQLISRLQTLHTDGYLYLDLKPDNIVLGSSNMNLPDSSIIYLVDFGISKSYLNESVEHLPQAFNVPFSGNILFASKYAFMNLEQSRRDDLISLAYLLAFFVNGSLDWLGDLRSSDPWFINKVGQIKQALTPQSLCSGRARPLLPFCKEIFQLEFE